MELPNYNLFLRTIYQNLIMRKLVLLIIVVLSFTGVVFAQKNEIGIKLGYSLIKPNDYDPGTIFGLSYTRYFTNTIGMGVTLNGFTYNVRGLEDNLINTFDGIHVASRFHLADDLLFTAKFGIGIYTCSYPEFTILFENSSTLDVPEMNPYAIGYMINAGLRYDITERFGFGLNLDYIGSGSLEFKAFGIDLAEEEQQSINITLATTFRF